MDHGIVCCCSVARSWELKIATRNYSIDITDEHRLSAEVRECSPVCFSCLLWRNWFVDEVFFVRIESSNRIGRCNQTTVVYTLHLQRIFNPSVFCICDEQQWCTAYGTPNWVLVYFNSVIKRVKQCCCTLILLPKSTYKRKFNHQQSFLYEWRLTARTIRKFRIGPSIRIESRIGHTIRYWIESRSFTGP